MPQVGHAVCCNFGCWHCAHNDVAAGVVFHELRRERVRERDIFRFGTGMVLLLVNRENYRFTRDLLAVASSRGKVSPIAPK